MNLPRGRTTIIIPKRHFQEDIKNVVRDYTHRIAEQKMAIWECDNCKDRTIETASEDKDVWGKKMPSGGWGCWKCGKGRRKFKSWAKVR